MWIGKIGNHDIPVVAALPRYGFVLGNLTATPSYLRMPSQITFQLVYLGKPNEALVDRDCGAPVVDKSTGYFYGHVVQAVLDLESGSSFQLVRWLRILRHDSVRSLAWIV